MAGNLVNNNGTTRTYNAANQMVDDGTNTLTYDANGNLTNDGVNAYTWDRANRMLTAPGSTSYKYDGLSNRIQQTVSSVVTDYLNDVQPGLVKLLRQDDGTNVDHFVHAVRGIHAVDDGTDWTWFAQDGLGSVRGLVVEDAVVQTTHEYDPYGNYIGTAPTDAYFGFTGEQTQGNGQVYLRARYYNPSMGVFPSLDTDEGMTCTPMSLNGYSYVHGNPIMNTDPTGMTCCDEYRYEPVAYRACMANPANQHEETPTPPPTATPNPYSLYMTITAETIQYFSESAELDCLTRAVQNEVGIVGSRIEEQAEWVTWAILNRRAVTRELDYQTTPSDGGICGSNGTYSHCAADCRAIDVDERIARVVRTTINSFQYRSQGSDPTYGAAGWRQNPNRPFVRAGEELATIWPQIADLNGRCGDFFCRKRKAFFPNDAVVAPCQGSDYVESVSDFYDRVENRQNDLNNFYGNTRRSTRFNMTRDEASTYLGGCVERIYVTTVNTCNAGADGDNICWITGNSEFRP